MALIAFLWNTMATCQASLIRVRSMVQVHLGPRQILVSGSSGKGESTGGLLRLRKNDDPYPQNPPVAFEVSAQKYGFV